MDVSQKDGVADPLRVDVTVTLSLLEDEGELDAERVGAADREIPELRLVEGVSDDVLDPDAQAVSVGVADMEDDGFPLPDPRGLDEEDAERVVVIVCVIVAEREFREDEVTVGDEDDDGDSVAVLVPDLVAIGVHVELPDSEGDVDVVEVSVKDDVVQAEVEGLAVAVGVGVPRSDIVGETVAELVAEPDTLNEEVEDGHALRDEVAENEADIVDELVRESVLESVADDDLVKSTTVEETDTLTVAVGECVPDTDAVVVPEEHGFAEVDTLWVVAAVVEAVPVERREVEPDADVRRLMLNRDELERVNTELDVTEIKGVYE